MLFVFMITCFQAFLLIASNDNNRGAVFLENPQADKFLRRQNIEPINALELEKIIKVFFPEDKIDILAQPKNIMNASCLDNVTSATVGIEITSNSESKNESQQSNDTLASVFYPILKPIIEEKQPHFLPYFDVEILQLLADIFDKEQIPNKLKGFYIGTIFVDTSELVFSKAFKKICDLLKELRFDGTIPFNFLVAENDSYKKIIKEVLKECLEAQSLHYEIISNKNNNPEERSSLVLTGPSLEALAHKIVDKVDSLLQLNIQEHYDRTYTSYSLAKFAESIDDYIKKNLQIQQQDTIGILRRIVYDINDLIAIDLKDEEEKQLGEVQKIVNLNNQEKKGLEKCERINNQVRKHMISYFYNFFQTVLLEKTWDELNSFNKKYSLNIQYEEVSYFITAIFEMYPYNIFHVDPHGHLMPTRAFIDYLVENFIENANCLVEEKKQNNEFVPRFNLQKDISYKGLEKALEELEQKHVKARDSFFEVVFAEQSRKEEEEKNKRLQEIASRVQASYLEQCSKEKEEEENKRLKQEKAAANKIKREEEERALQDEQEQKEAARKQRQEQQNSLRQVAGQELQKLKNDRLKILAEKRAVLYDYKNEAKELEAFDVVGLIDEASKAIEEQQKLITKSNNKVIKKILSESLSSYQKIDVDVLAIEKRLQDRKESPKQNTNNESLAMDLVSIEQEESKKDNLIENHTIAAVVVGTLNQPKKIKRYTHNPYDPDYTFVRKQSNVADKKLDDVSNDPFAEKVLVSGTSKNSGQKLLTQDSHNLSASPLGRAFYPEKYTKKESSQNNSCYPDENEATEKVELYDCSCLNTKSAVLGQDKKCINCRLKR